jgi:hypothetical protein
VVAYGFTPSTQVAEAEDLEFKASLCYLTDTVSRKIKYKHKWLINVPSNNYLQRKLRRKLSFYKY